MERQVQLQAITEYAEHIFQSDTTGHDYAHMKRVARTARQIAEEEGADVFLCEAAGLLHDVGDHKLFSDTEAVHRKMADFLHSIGLAKKEVTDILSIINGVSFSKGVKRPELLEGRIVQDADRLDAIGAIGIARTFAYGGSKNRPMHAEGDDQTSIQHFYDKLLKLKDLMHTEAARGIAEERHAFMEAFLVQFYKEW